ncbi:hypothetical protein [Eubacterium sp. AB3007]|uniref:hypothetical protein n=1 Tax=Eubacterium sp. AB3007 TaxID=1392487 RepID=UPI00163AE754|nr:hypothetical protein [Eubacterium sp. AB3007]
MHAVEPKATNNIQRSVGFSAAISQNRYSADLIPFVNSGNRLAKKQGPSLLR